MFSVRHLRAVLAIGCLLSSAYAQVGINLNRIVATQVVDHMTGDGELVFVDADTLQVDAYPLPAGFIPGVLVAMDRNGDVWLSRYQSNLLYKFSGVDGSVLAVANPPLPCTAITTDRFGHLVAATTGPFGVGVPQSAYLYEYDGNGVLVRSLDVMTLFPPGGFLGRTNGFYVDQFGGVRNLVMEPGGGLWFTVHTATASPVIKIDQAWNLVASFGIYLPYNMRPDSAGGVWINHHTGIMTGTYSPTSQVMPGLPVMRGWVHLDAQGTILESTFDCGTCGFYRGRIRSDGRQFLAYGGYEIQVHRVGVTGSPWFPLADRIPLPVSPNIGLMNVELDGSQRVWTLRTGGFNAPQDWHRSSLEPPYLGPREVGVTIGETWGVNVGNPQPFATIGENSLFRYCKATDPLGDLDGDGVGNLDELNSFSNPLVAFGGSSRPAATVAFDPLGTSVSVTWSVPGDMGLAYAAPFGLGTSLESLGGGNFIPMSLQDGLVQASLFGHPALSNTVGFLDLQGMATVSAMLPSSPSLTGLTVSTFIATLDSGSPALFETVSWPVTFSLP